MPRCAGLGLARRSEASSRPVCRGNTHLRSIIFASGVRRTKDGAVAARRIGIVRATRISQCGFKPYRSRWQGNARRKATTRPSAFSPAVPTRVAVIVRGISAQPYSVSVHKVNSGENRLECMTGCPMSEISRL